MSQKKKICKFNNSSKSWQKNPQKNYLILVADILPHEETKSAKFPSKLWKNK